MLSGRQRGSPAKQRFQSLGKGVVPRKGLEPSRPLSHWHLKPARLPIPPPGHVAGLVRIGQALVKSLQRRPNTLYSDRVLAYRESAKSHRYLSNSTGRNSTHGIEPGNARHGFWRIGVSGTKRGPGAGQARLPDQGGGAAAGAGRGPATARPG